MRKLPPSDDRKNMQRISWERTTPEGWQDALKNRFLLDVSVTPAEARTIVKYLSSSHGLRARGSEAGDVRCRAPRSRGNLNPKRPCAREMLEMPRVCARACLAAIGGRLEAVRCHPSPSAIRSPGRGGTFPKARLLCTPRCILPSGHAARRTELGRPMAWRAICRAMGELLARCKSIGMAREDYTTLE